MARTKYKDILKDGITDIAGKYLVVDTVQNGFFNIYKGLHPFRVIQDSAGQYAVYPVYWSDENKLTNEPYPIIRTIDGDVFFVKRTLNDPYNGPQGEEVSNDDSLEKRVVDAFNVFAHDEFNLGYPNPIHVFIGDEEEIGVEDKPVDFEYRNVKGEVVEEPTGPVGP